MNKFKKLSMLISSAGLVLLLTGITYAFFNYTRTGGQNIVRVGNINFSSSESTAITLTNVFPISRTEAPEDNVNSGEIVITISGDTTYTNGVEYLVSMEDVNIETSLHKKLPIGVIVTPEKTGELGTSDTNYFTNRGGSTSLYKVMANETVLEDDYVLVGYIRPGAAEVNGTIGIRAFIDFDNIAISDTFDETESNEMGTTNDWVRGRTVVTTEEWNSLNGNNSLSFKIKVEANEGIWVPEPTTRNDMGQLGSSFNRSSITEINFIRMSEEMINTHSDAIDITEEGGQGLVKAWVDGTKLYIASPGTTYFPVNSEALLTSFTNVTKYDFNNIDTSEVENMKSMFSANSSLSYINIDTFDTSNVTTMYEMFSGCSSLTSLDLSYLDTSSVTTMVGMFASCSNLESVNLSGLGSDVLTGFNGAFYGCSNLKNVNMSEFNFGLMTALNGVLMTSGTNQIETVNFKGADMRNSTSVGGMITGAVKTVNFDDAIFGSSTVSLFATAPNLESVSFKNADMSRVTSTSYMFSGNSKITSIDLSGADFSNVISLNATFTNVTNLVEVNLSNVDASSTTNLGYICSSCSNLKTVNMSNFVFGTSAQNMFKNLSSLESVNFNGADMSNVTNVDSMFYGCSSLKTLDMGGLGTGSVTNSSNMLESCTSIESINLSGFAANSTGYIYPNTINGATNVKTIDISNSKISYASTMFSSMTNLESVDMSNTNISYSSTNGMFTYNSKLKTVNFSGSDISSLYGIFISSDITSMKLIGHNLNSLTDISYMFQGCDDLKTVDLSEFDVSHVTDMSNLFHNCTDLANANLGNFTNSVVTNLRFTFGNCTSLTSVDLSGLSTSNVTDVYQMFSGDNKLQTIYVSNSWDVSSVTSSTENYGMFLNCTSLVGGNGTTYNAMYALHVQETYPERAYNNLHAVIDAPSTPGYLTLKS